MFAVLVWQGLGLKDYKKIGIFDEQTAWAVAKKCWQNPRTRLALVVMLPPKDLEDMLSREINDPSRYTIPRELTGNYPPDDWSGRLKYTSG